MHTYDFLADPRSITLQERRATATRLHHDQAHWLLRLQSLCEPPTPEHDFPAFLLATQPFADLAGRIGPARTRAELAPAVADEVDWFVRAFADYLRSCDGEEVFTGNDGHLSE